MKKCVRTRFHHGLEASPFACNRHLAWSELLPADEAVPPVSAETQVGEGA